MSINTKIQWCDSTVNPIMGCAGCELFPPAKKILNELDDELLKILPGWKNGLAGAFFKKMIEEAYDEIEEPGQGHTNEVTTTNIWHLRFKFEEMVIMDYGEDKAEAVRAVIQESVTCYTGKLHLNRGYSLSKPDRKVNIGYAPTFEQITCFPGRVDDAAGYADLLGKTDPNRPWIDGLPRLIFVSDMGDAFSRKVDFDFLKKDTVPAIQSEKGKRHLWLWLTKRPQQMAKFAKEIGGMPENVCAMTTVTGPDTLYRIDELRKVNASIRGLSLEPLWERIPPQKLNLNGIHWVILGGESGSKVDYTRPFPIEWANELRAHCESKGVAFFLKQLGRRPTLNGELVKLKNAHGGDSSEWPAGAPNIREFPQAFHDYRKGEPFEEGLRSKPKLSRSSMN